MAHRGPDDRGAFVRPDGLPVAVLVHRRLAIIDRSCAGHQPMAHEGLSIVFNGEIYNYRELREELRAHGHTFESGSDTEVLLRAYTQWKDGCVARLRGMFAFAIWDENARTLFIARDHLGVKPLYYCVQGRTLLFASEDSYPASSTGKPCGATSATVRCRILRP